VLRRTLLAASSSRRLRRLAERSRASRAVAGRFVAGDSLDDAVAVVVALNRDGAAVTLDLLGEDVESPEQASAALVAYQQVIARLAQGDLDCSVSVKPSQFGLDLDPQAAAGLLRRLAEQATTAGIHVTLDMEGSPTTSAIVDLTAMLTTEGLDVGCAVQAYLHRTPADVARLTGAGSSLRICKGAYAEDAAIAYQRRKDVRAAYLRLVDDVWRSDTYGRFATHDDVLTDEIERRARERGIGRERFEFQLLHGVREPLARDLLARGNAVRIYVPFGTQWYPYYLRRLAERPANLLFLGRALVGRRASPGSRA